MLWPPCQMIWSGQPLKIHGVSQGDKSGRGILHIDLNNPFMWLVWIDFIVVVVIHPPLSQIVDGLHQLPAMSLTLVGWKDQGLTNSSDNARCRFVKGSLKMKQRKIACQGIGVSLCGGVLLKQVKNLPKSRVMVGHIDLIGIFNEPQG